ncbi:MAG: hypothetical protein J6Y77_01255, partial [Paludibacteraceae bacterium]|nr:hypothetical protein [Paludibacteraceae bacterium]
VGHWEADTSLVVVDDSSMDDDLAGVANIGALLYGEDNPCSNMLIEHRVLRNQSGWTAVLLRNVPRFILVDPNGQAKAYEDFRHAALPKLIARRGRDLVVDSKGFCATHTGFITEDFLALLTPSRHCVDWDASGPDRHLDLYRLTDGAYLGSIELPEGEKSTHWIFDLHLQGDDLWVYYSDMLESSTDHYKLTFDLEDNL